MNYDINYYKDEIHCLYDEKKELQQRINKAIDYIVKNTNLFPVSDNETICLFDTINASPRELLEILKGCDKE